MRSPLANLVSATCYWRAAVILGKAQPVDAVAGLAEAAAADKSSSIRVFEEALVLAKRTLKVKEADVSRLQTVCQQRWPTADKFKAAA